jgi:hypothetical protein
MWLLQVLQKRDVDVAASDAPITTTTTVRTIAEIVRLTVVSLNLT